MKKTILLFMVLLSVFGCTKEAENSEAAAADETKAIIGSMSHMQVDSLLRLMSSQDLSVTDRITYYSNLFMGTPYSWHATGDGADALYEAWPLVDLDSTNCMVYCEHVLALSISDSWDNFFNNLQQIRYQNGMIGMRTRNHYTMGDWLPENKWILDDVSAEVGGKYTQSMTRVISHETFFKNKGMTDLRHIKPDRNITVEYVPMEHVADVKSKIHNGDIVAMLYANKDNVFSAHMLMIVEKDGDLYFREASTTNYSTFETEFDKWLAWKGSWKKYAGLAFMRVKESVNKPNAVVLPWKIPELKGK